MPTTFIRDRILEVASRQPVPDPNRPSITRGRKREEPTEEETHFWIFVELTKPPASPDFYVVPEWWIENDIHRANGDYLAKHGGQRAITKDSTHHAIKSPASKSGATVGICSACSPRIDHHLRSVVNRVDRFEVRGPCFEMSGAQL
jgi:hypothetical protein